MFIKKNRTNRQIIQKSKKITIAEDTDHSVKNKIKSGKDVMRANTSRV